MPYVVFVKPPPLEELRLTRRRAKFICDEEDASTVRIFSVSTFRDACEGVGVQGQFQGCWVGA